MIKNDLFNVQMNHSKRLSEPWFTLVILGLKTVEGRLKRGNILDIKPGDTITFYNNDIFKREHTVYVSKCNTYNTFNDYLSTEGLSNCLPGIINNNDGLSVYYKYFNKSDEQKYGVIALKFN